MNAPRLVVLVLLGLFSTSIGCAASAAHPDEEESEARGTGDLPLGEIENALGTDGAATTCKAIPTVEPLVDPEITISLDALTLHLVDHAGTYDRVFPIGPGALDAGVSKTPVGKFYTGSDTTEVKDAGWGYYYPCKIWWTDPETQKKSPVFAGLPFIRLAGTPTAGYALHGPIDGYSAANGGSLRRGFVSHGCVRMAAADIVEVYARIHRHKRTKVTIQHAAERRADGSQVEVDARWIGDACEADADCNYAGGTCASGTCTLPCTHGCPDRPGAAPTFCAQRPDGKGLCMPQASSTFNATCARYGSRLVSENVTRPDRSGRATVCSPR